MRHKNKSIKERKRLKKAGAKGRERMACGRKGKCGRVFLAITSRRQKQRAKKAGPKVKGTRDRGSECARVADAVAVVLVGVEVPD